LAMRQCMHLLCPLIQLICMLQILLVDAVRFLPLCLRSNPALAAENLLALPKEMSARQFLRYIGAMFGFTGAPLERRIAELLELFGLAAVADKRLGAFSSGMMQKVGLAQTLISRRSCSASQSSSLAGWSIERRGVR
jgi:ABC-type Na+ transport system ATPase subunit NatA